MRGLNIAIVGATGLVGSKFIEILQEFNVECSNLYLYASARSAGKEIDAFNKKHTVIELAKENILDKEIDYALFSAGGNVSLEFAKYFVKIGATVIDNSSAYRMDENVPLVVPEVNIEAARVNNGIIANPNCSTIQAVLPLDVLAQYGIKSVEYVTFQAVSGSGLKGIKDLEDTSKGLEPSNYPHPIYNNCLPHIDRFLDNGYTFEEMKMINETRKILDQKDLAVTATCVRVPVYNSHSVEMSVELMNEVEVKKLYKEFTAKEGIMVMDCPQHNVYPLATFATGTNEVYVGRIRKDLNNPNKIHLFCVADNIRKGAALNAIQIMLKLEGGATNV